MKVKFIRFLSIAAILAMLVTTVGTLSVFAGAVTSETALTRATTANNWGRSDLRSYLNGVAKKGDTLPFNTDHSQRQAEGYFESCFNDDEYALIAPYTYNLSINDTEYSLTDKFWLPSGNYRKDNIISFGASDISSDEVQLDTSRIIPISYWSYGNSWLRSVDSYGDAYALSAYRGIGAFSNTVNMDNINVAPAFKIDISDVTFAAMASVDSLETRYAASYQIMGTSDFGKQTRNALPDYGMYLKTASDSSFNATNISYIYTDTYLSITFDNATVGDYVVIQAYRNDNLIDGCKFYAAIQKIYDPSGTMTIDLRNWNIPSLDGCVIKVWAESADSESGLAKATAPQTFKGMGGAIVEVGQSASCNPRVFAMKDELGCSWGTLANDSDLVGVNPTNQKIYFGTDSNERPMEFWIAARESYDNGKSPIDGDGTIDANGNIMTLYSAKSVEMRVFNSSTDNFKDVPTVDMFDVTVPTAYVYDGNKVKASVTSEIYSLDDITVKYYDEKNKLIAEPTDAGRYKVTVDVPGSESYEAITDLCVAEFSIEKKLVTVTAEDKTVCVNESPKYSYTVDGFIGDDHLITEPSFTSNSDGKTAGEYTITASGAIANANYAIEYVEGKLTVNEHQYSDWEELDDKKHQRSCECGDIASAEHVWDEGNVIKAPDCSNSGEKTVTCTECKATRTETIESLGHSYDNLCDKDCNVCGADRVTEHSDADKNGICDECSYEYPKAEPSETDGDGMTDKPNDSEKDEENTDKKTDKETDKETDEETDEKKNGCGSSLMLSAFAIVGIAGTAIVIKKKEY